MSKNSQSKDKIPPAPEVDIFFKLKQTSILLSGSIYEQTLPNMIPFTRKDGSLAGYVTKDKNRIIVSYHRTKSISEVLSDLNAFPAAIKLGDKTVRVHSGFNNVFVDSEDNMNAAIAQLDPNNKMDITFCGHSMGGALAQLAALKHKITHPESNVSVITHGGPRVFCSAAAKLNNKLLGLSTLLVQQTGDPIVKLPPPPMYSHSGFYRIKASPKEKMPMHQPDAYYDIAKNITLDDLQKAGEHTIKLKTRYDLMQDSKNLGKQIRQDREERVLNAVRNLVQGKLGEAFNSITNGETRNILLDQQRKVDLELKEKSRWRN